MTSVKGQPWFETPQLQKVLTLLNREGGEARLVGGALRNALMGLPVSDFDIATTHKPEEVIKLATAASVKVVPTGLAHGTVTLVVDGMPFEVTTLRIDVKTDGRRAEVAYTDNWKADAERRDFTINALYADIDGAVHDDVGGLADIETRTLRFIGSAADRIAEDYLRVLRFFRFFAHYGNGRPDAEGLKACAAARDKLKTLSAERVWSELKKLLGAKDPGRAMLWMRTTGVLPEILPESAKWGIDAIGGLIEAEQQFGWQIDPLLRLAAIVPPDADRLAVMSQRLRLSRQDAAFLAAFAKAPVIADDLPTPSLLRLLYRHGLSGIMARLKLMIASELQSGCKGSDRKARLRRLTSLLATSAAWKKPVFPVKGSDLMEAGLPAGPALGVKLGELETKWVDADFSLGKEELVAMALLSTP